MAGKAIRLWTGCESTSKGTARIARPHATAIRTASTSAPTMGALKIAYRWGKELAQGKSYTASRPSSQTAGNPDSDGRELTNGIIIATDQSHDGQSRATGHSILGCGRSGDVRRHLGSLQKVGGVRAWTHQPNDRFCHPKSIHVDVSVNGRAWSAMGTIRHDDLWKPPGDFEAWEHDDDPRYAALPAAGRLAYGYPLIPKKPIAGRYVRLVCTPLPGKGMGLSEFQVFDAASIVPWPGEAALPAMP